MVKFLKELQQLNQSTLNQQDKHRNAHRLKKRRVELVCTEQEYSALAASAKKHKQSLSPFIINCAFAYLKKGFILPDDFQVKRMEEAFVRLGNNLNQLAYHVNKNKSVSEPQVNQALQIIQQLETRLKELFLKPISIEDEITKQAQNDPELLKRLLYVLIDMKK